MATNINSLGLQCFGIFQHYPPDSFILIFSVQSWLLSKTTCQHPWRRPSQEYKCYRPSPHNNSVKSGKRCECWADLLFLHDAAKCYLAYFLNNPNRWEMVRYHARLPQMNLHMKNAEGEYFKIGLKCNYAAFSLGVLCVLATNGLLECIKESHNHS